MSADQIYAISGLLSPSQESILTITATDSDEVVVIRGSPPQKITNSDLLRKLMPAIAIIFFYGFGKPFQKRFWKQYRQLNTRSLHNRMRETQVRAKKSGLSTDYVNIGKEHKLVKRSLDLHFNYCLLSFLMAPINNVAR
jgi:hypothetical protein